MTATSCDRAESSRSRSPASRLMLRRLEVDDRRVERGPRDGSVPGTEQRRGRALGIRERAGKYEVVGQTLVAGLVA